MLLRRVSLVLSAALLTACSGEPAPRTLLDTERARVSARVLRDGERWRVRDIQAVARGDEGLLELRLRAFFDADGDGELDEGEERGAWRTSSTVPSRELALSGSLGWSTLETSPLDPSHIETLVATRSGRDLEVRSTFE